MLIALRACALALAVTLLFAPIAKASSVKETVTFGRAASQATETLLNVYYTGGGMWRDCNKTSCNQANSDWGVDSATNSLYLRWKITHDARIRGVMAQLLETAPKYPAPCGDTGCSAWSDTPEWDAVTLMREYEVLGDPEALSRAKAAFDYVENSRTFSLGACPSIRYQLPQPSSINVKTLETEANAIKAAILLYRATNDRAYLDSATQRYAAARKYFLDPNVPLYTVHVRDDGANCVQEPRRFFASVNGAMIWNGIALWHLTGDVSFHDEALATAHAVDSNLADARGVFTDEPGENDVVEPLVEAMDDLAVNEQQPFAREWILRNAAAALSARGTDGSFSRFFDGPAQTETSIWESNGGLALEIAASALDPAASVPDADAWSEGRYVGSGITTLPATIEIDGSGVALIGTIGKNCEKAHVHVLIDGMETFDQTGLWQNSSMPDGDSVFFAWRWKAPGPHTITLLPSNPGEAGDAQLHLSTYVLK
jgi:hypothetical protein